MTPSPNDDNHRVTNAILSTKLDALTAEVQQLCNKMDRRLVSLEELLHCETSDLRARCEDHSTQIARLDERQKAITGFQAALALVASTVAGIVGSLK